MQKRSKTVADFNDGFWSLFIAGVTLVSIIACALQLLGQGAKVKHGEKVETTGHEWDGNLAELNNPLPRWWATLYILTIVFSLGYLVLYPGLGSFAGTLGWSSAGQYQGEQKDADAQYGPLFKKYATLEIEAIARDPAARAIGERLFLTYCSQCHGSDARGAKGFPNLTDKDWLYGGEPAAILASILEGRKGAMPPMGDAMGGPEGVKDMANYVLSLSGAAHDKARAERAQPKFAICGACHGPEGKGNPQLGAPNLTDKVWLYGSSLETIAEGISGGRANMMPAHREFLGEEKSRILAGYVYGLGAK
jgi:cytochrome c oxidase cbb3-type subunit 3